MDSKLNCPSYTDIVTIIESSSSTNHAFLRRLVDHIQLYCDVLHRAHNSVSTVTPSFIQTQADSKSSTGELVSSTTCEFSRAWRSLLENSLNPTPVIEATTKAFDALLLSLSSNADEYKEHIDAVIQKARDSLQRLASASENAKSTHRSYAEAGKAVETAYAQNSHSYPELLRRFGQLQTAAVNAHRESNLVRGTVTTSFAEYLSDFERIEEGRSSKLSKTLREFSEALQRLSERFGEAANSMRQGLQFSDESESKMFEDTSFLKDAAASVRYQAVPVPGEACMFLDMKKFFHLELKVGGKLAEVTDGFRGGSEYLDVVKGEIVCIIEDLQTVKKCRNINECLGLVPASVLKPV